ncbi:MAG: hypothetical protein PHI97_10245 [Desulfobulbus sp.]|nr:hypothetical protein [Desulfobulbus sp.]
MKHYETSRLALHNPLRLWCREFDMPSRLPQTLHRLNGPVKVFSR